LKTHFQLWRVIENLYFAFVAIGFHTFLVLILRNKSRERENDMNRKGGLDSAKVVQELVYGHRASFHIPITHDIKRKITEIKISRQ
jgi:hypothetical protein